MTRRAAPKTAEKAGAVGAAKPAAAKAAKPAASSSRRRSTKTDADAAPQKAAAAAKAAKPASRRSKAASTATAKPSSSAARKPARKPATAKSAAAKPIAAKSKAAKPTTAKADPAKAMTQAASATASQAAPSPPQPAHDDSGFGGALAATHLSEAMLNNLERLEMLSNRLVSAMSTRVVHDPGVEGPGAEFYANAAHAWMRMLAEQPARVIEQQVNFWGETIKHYARAQAEFLRGSLHAPEDDGPRDRRFSNPLWQKHPYFNFIKRQYQINAEAMRTAAESLAIEDGTEKRRVNWLTSQIIDMMAPTNFLATNPDALEKAVETEGESLVKGLENLVRDVEQNGGEFLVSLADRDAFTVGENIGTAEGRVVHRTPLFELIQYAPSTDQVHALPVLLFPPWINKFYILDLKPQNSLIRWVVDQGHTLFVVSWKNPDGSYANIGMDDYVAAYIDAMDKVAEITGQKQLNAVGYCIAGTTLSVTLGLLKKRGDTRVKSATFFTTLTDFSDLGEFSTFLQDDFLSGIEEEVSRKGVFGAALMSRTMSFLRANDLVWGPAIRNYMLGETPPAFDLLYWNGDSTNLPGRMTLEYLDRLCRQNALPEKGFPVMGETVTLADVTVPLCSVGCETDHIAPWKDCWRGVKQMGSADKRFILSESGHIAGIVNPPSKKKYGHYLGDQDFAGSYEGWKQAASFHEGSWWPVWGEWLSGHAGGMVPARVPDEKLGPAPGDYVHERAVG